MTTKLTGVSAPPPVPGITGSGGSQQGEGVREGDRKGAWGEGEVRSFVVEGRRRHQAAWPGAHCSPPHTPWPRGAGHIPHSGGPLVVREAPVGEGREVWGTGSRLRKASQGVDLAGPGILVPLEIDRVCRIEGGVLVKEVVGSEEEAHSVAHSHRVGNIFCMRDVQETSCHPGHQVLAREKKEDLRPGFVKDIPASYSLGCEDSAHQPRRNVKSQVFFVFDFWLFFLVGSKDPQGIWLGSEPGSSSLLASPPPLASTSSSLSADLPCNGLIIDEVSEIHSGSPRVIQIVDAGAAGLFFLPLRYGQLVPTGDVD